MTQITKRILALLMAMAMLFAVVGCGEDKDPAENSSTTETTSSEEETSSEEDTASEEETSSEDDEVQDIESEDKDTEKDEDKDEDETSSKKSSSKTSSKKNSSKTSSKKNSSKTSSKKNSSKTSSKKTSGVSDDDFFGDDAVENIEDTTSKTESKVESTSKDPAAPTKKPSNAQNANYWKEIKEKIPSSLEGKTIQYYNWNAIEEYPGLTSVIKSFTKATGIQVKYVREDYRTYLQKLTSLIATDKAPDIIRTHSPTPHVWTLSQDLSVSKFDDYKNSVWDQTFMGFHTVNGKVYAANTTSTIFAGAPMLFYNRSLISKYNLDDPYKLWNNDKWDIDAFEKVMKDFKKASGNAALGGDLINHYLTKIYGLPGEIEFDTKSQKFVSKLDDSRVIGVMQRAANLINKDNLTVSWGLDEFDRGEILFFCGTGVTVKRMNPYAATVKAAGNLGTVPWPSVTGNKNDGHSTWGDDGFAIPKGAKYPEAFPYFVFYVTDPARYDLSTYFADDQAAEVFDFLTSLPASQKFCGVAFDNVSENFVGEYSSIADAYMGKTGDQIPAVLNANANLSQLRADEYNKVLATVGK